MRAVINDCILHQVDLSSDVHRCLCENEDPASVSKEQGKKLQAGIRHEQDRRCLLVCPKLESSA